MPRPPNDDELNKIKFANPDYTGRHNITRLDKKIKRAWCNNCCQWVSAVQFEANGSWHCRKSYAVFRKKIHDSPSRW